MLSRAPVTDDLGGGDFKLDMGPPMADYKPKGQWLTYHYQLHSIVAYKPGTKTKHTPVVWYSNGKWHTYTKRGANLDATVTWVADKPLTAGYQPQYVGCTLKVR